MLNNHSLRQARKQGLFLDTYESEERREIDRKKFAAWAISLLLCTILWIMALCGCVHAKEVITEPNIEGYSLNQWCEAIHNAEGNDNYGILTHYSHTTPLQACRNTVLHKYRDWIATGQRKRFLDYLAERYAPIGANNDPNDLNKNWAGNVKYWLEMGS